MTVEYIKPMSCWSWWVWLLAQRQRSDWYQGTPDSVEDVSEILYCFLYERRVYSWGMTSTYDTARDPLLICLGRRVYSRQIWEGFVTTWTSTFCGQSVNPQKEIFLFFSIYYLSLSRLSQTVVVTSATSWQMSRYKTDDLLIFGPSRDHGHRDILTPLI